MVDAHLDQGLSVDVHEIDERSQAGYARLPGDVVVEDRQPVVEHHGVDERRERVDVLAQGLPKVLVSLLGCSPQERLGCAEGEWVEHRHQAVAAECRPVC
jgi:hypothetical protein